MTGLQERDAAAGAVQKAPRVTLDQIKGLIVGERYFVDDTLTICVLTLSNGYKVTGESAAADPANFNEDLGRKIAKDKATAEIWPLAGFLLRDKLHREERPSVVRCKFVVSGKGAQAKPAADAQWDHVQGSYDKVLPDGAMVMMSAISEAGAEDGGNACMENRIFSEATPFAMLQMHIRNQRALDALPNGKTFYVDFTPAD